jgi:iron uptake system component EfeO
MKKTFTIGLLSLMAMSCVAYGCGDDDDDNQPNNPGGSAGSGGGGSGGVLSAAEELKLRTDMHTLVAGETTKLKSAAEALCAAAPDDAAGWDDTAALDAMKAAWVETRGPYERIEGLVAPLFSDIDAAIDERYDGFVAVGAGQTPVPDPNLFDGQVVTGMHAIERILYHLNAPEALGEEEASLGAGYTAPAYPETDEEATDFKTKLCGQLVLDTGKLVDEWAALKRPDGTLSFDLGAAYQGLLDLVGEQGEKINNAATQLDESRYSKRTLADLRQNLTGVKNAYNFVAPLIKARPNASDPEHDGVAIDARIVASFGRLEAAYAAVSGDAIPTAPDDWQAQEPTPANLMTDFGKFFKSVSDEIDPSNEDSAAHGLEEAAEILGITLPVGE